MSSDLSVQLRRPVEITELVHAASIAIGELFTLPHRPMFRVFELKERVWHPIPEGRVGEDGQVFALKVDGLREAVGLTVVNLPQHPMIPENESGLWAGIDVSAMRTPLEFAMAASIAVALARLVDTTVIDDALRWNSIYEQSPNEFLRAVSGPDSLVDLASASATLTAAINRPS